MLWNIVITVLVIMVIWGVLANVFASTNSKKKKIIDKKTDKRAYACLSDRDLSAADVAELFVPYKEKLKEFRSVEKKLARIVEYVGKTGDLNGLNLEEYKEEAQKTSQFEEDVQHFLWDIEFQKEQSEEKFQKIVDDFSDVASEIESHIDDIETIIDDIKNGEFEPIVRVKKSPKLKVNRKELLKKIFEPAKHKEAAYRILYKSMEGNLSLWDISIYSKHKTGRFNALVYKKDEIVSLSFNLERVEKVVDLSTGKEIQDFSILLEKVPMLKK